MGTSAASGASRKRVGIIGAGVGGLTAALALERRADLDVRVYERSERTALRGAAVLLWTNAVAALRTIGIADAVLAASASVARTDFRGVRGELLCSLPVSDWSAQSGAPTVVIRRAKLLDILESALPLGLVRSGAVFRSYTRERAGVRIHFDDGTSELVDALIGADGLHSAVRAQLHGQRAPRMLGCDAWIGIAHHEGRSRASQVTTATVGRGPRFWSAVLADGAVFWYATIPQRGRPSSTHDELQEVFRDWHAPIAELIAATPVHDLVHSRICDRAPIDTWGEGPVTLLGDAAHPTTPDLGQGACQAIESAAVLARSLVPARPLAEGLREYERRRMRRTAAINRLCWLTSTNSTIEDPTLCRLRDVAMKVALERAARSSLSWILAGPAAT